MEYPERKYEVFISYSHQDIELVSPIVDLLKTLRNDLVFQDKKDICPGKQWSYQIQKALSDAQLIIVFWCSHSANSGHVRNEYMTGISSHKDILPLLLDDTELPNELSAYQWIDFSIMKFHFSTGISKNKGNIETVYSYGLLIPIIGAAITSFVYFLTHPNKIEKLYSFLKILFLWILISVTICLVIYALFRVFLRTHIEYFKFRPKIVAKRIKRTLDKKIPRR